MLKIFSLIELVPLNFEVHEHVIDDPTFKVPIRYPIP